MEIAAKRDCWSFCADLIAQGACDDGSALAIAASKRNLEVTKFLVEEAHTDANILLKTGYYGSALAAAAVEGDLEVVKYLVEEAQADANLLLNTGPYGSALAAAAAGGELEVVNYLVKETQADVNLFPLDAGGRGSPLAFAVEEGDMDTVQYLVEVGKADVNLQFRHREFNSALEVALSRADQSIARYLMSQGAVQRNARQ